jgi:hypothetical protein
MAETEPSTLVPSDEYPPSTLQTIFAEGVSSITPGRDVVRFYLYRFLPGLRKANTHTMYAAAQVVLPTVGFIKTFVFFERALGMLIASGAVTQEQVEKARKADQEYVDAAKQN